MEEFVAIPALKSAPRRHNKAVLGQNLGRRIPKMRRERNIYKRKDGRYEARYIKGYGENGKAVYGAVYARSYAEVKEKLGNVTLHPIAPVGAGRGRTVVQEMETYLDTIRCQIKPSTLGVYQRYLSNYIAPFFGSTRCDQLTAEMAQSFVNRQMESGLSAVTVQSAFCFLKNGLNGAFRQNVFGVKLPKYKAAEVEVLSVEEQKRLEAAANASDDINRIGVTLCLYTGIRLGELCGLMWGDIDPERRLLHVRRTLQRIKNTEGGDAQRTKMTTSPPKSSASLRSIPLPGFLMVLLEECGKPDGYVISRGGAAIEPRNMQYRFSKLLTAANVKPVNFHVTRHTFATRALENGFDIKTLSEILGHSSATITLQKYAHTMDAHKRRSMESLAAVYH
jgi:integrase